MLLIHEIADTLLRRFRLGQILEVLAKVFQADFSDRAGNSVFPALIFVGGRLPIVNLSGGVLVRV
jgi:hypothetical protein